MRRVSCSSIRDLGLASVVPGLGPRASFLPKKKLAKEQVLLGLGCRETPRIEKHIEAGGPLGRAGPESFAIDPVLGGLETLPSRHAGREIDLFPLGMTPRFLEILEF